MIRAIAIFTTDRMPASSEWTAARAPRRISSQTRACENASSMAEYFTSTSAGMLGAPSRRSSALRTPVAAVAIALASPIARARSSAFDAARSAAALAITPCAAPAAAGAASMTAAVAAARAIATMVFRLTRSSAITARGSVNVLDPGNVIAGNRASAPPLVAVRASAGIVVPRRSMPAVAVSPRAPIARSILAAAARTVVVHATRIAAI